MPLVNIDAHRLDADVVDVVGLVKNHDRVPAHFAGNKLGNFGIQEVVVAVHDNIAVGYLYDKAQGKARRWAEGSRKEGRSHGQAGWLSD